MPYQMDLFRLQGIGSSIVSQQQASSLQRNWRMNMKWPRTRCSSIRSAKSRIDEVPMQHAPVRCKESHAQMTRFRQLSILPGFGIWRHVAVVECTPQSVPCPPFSHRRQFLIQCSAWACDVIFSPCSLPTVRADKLTTWLNRQIGKISAILLQT